MGDGGGLLSAVIGPQLVKVTAQEFVVPFLGTYLAVIALNGWDVPVPVPRHPDAPPAPVTGDAPKAAAGWSC
jgi:hypothetical protein